MTSQAMEMMGQAPQHPRSVMRSVRGCARLVAGLALFLVAPVWLGIAVSIGATQALAWPTWYALAMSLVGIGLWVRGCMLRRLSRENMRKASDERDNLRDRIAAEASIPFLASLSAATAREADEIVKDFHGLMDAHAAMMAARDLFALAPAWRRVWDNELGPVYEDLTVVETLAETVQWQSNEPEVLSMAASLKLWLNEQRLAANDLGVSLERAQMDPAGALTQLDRIADEARVRLVRLIEAALGADTSMIGRRRS